VRKFSLVLGVLIGVAASEQPSSAQSLTFSLFESYLESVRIEAGVPAISAAIVQNGTVAWTRGFGRQDVEGAVPATANTPYLIGSLTQVIGSTVLLRKCVDQFYAEVNDPVVRWNPSHPEPGTTIAQLLSHIAPDGSFKFDPARMAMLTPVVEECAHKKYSEVLAEEVFEQLAMTHSVPGQALATRTSTDSAVLGSARLSRYADILRQLAVPYRIVNRRATRNPDIVPTSADVARGVVSSAWDLAQFDLALDSGYLAPATRVLALSQAYSSGRPLRTGLGWFAQAYNNEPIAWQFGVVEGGYSSLIVKVPNRRLTLILLANSDGLSAPFALDAGDVTTSIFARLFLRTFVP
jgi:CubicO group peptidase (beta-lactamase class C family)